MKRRIVLTTRERQVVGYLERGLAYKDVAREFGISESTARVHGSNAFAKLHRGRLALMSSKRQGTAPA